MKANASKMPTQKTESKPSSKTLLLGWFMLALLFTTPLFAQTAEVEPNNDCSTANLIADNGTFTGEISAGTDEDWFYFQGTNSDVTITFAPSGTTNDFGYDVYERTTNCGINNSIPVDQKLYAFEGGGPYTFPTSSNRVYLVKMTNGIFGDPFPVEYTFTISGLVTVPDLFPGGIADLPTIWLHTGAGITLSTFNGIASWDNSGSIPMTLTGFGNPATGSKPRLLFSANGYPGAWVSFDNTTNTATYFESNTIANPAGISGSDVVSTQFVVYHRNNIATNELPLYDFGNNGVAASTFTMSTLGTFSQNSYEKPLAIPTLAENPSRQTMVDASATTTPSSGTINLNHEGKPEVGSATGTYQAANGNGIFRIGKNSFVTGSSVTWEIIIYPRILAPQEIHRVQSYLAIKYGIPLGRNNDAISYIRSNGAAFWTANATFKYNIIGIGRDYSSGINQSSSTSSYTTSTTPNAISGKGALTISSPSDLDDGEFLMIGDDNGDTNR